MPQGQYEAAKILGYTKAQTFIRIILPQVIKRILPAITNETITPVKDTSLAFTIGVTEMFTMAKALASGQVSMLPYAFAALFYYILNLVVAFIMERIEEENELLSVGGKVIESSGNKKCEEKLWRSGSIKRHFSESR